MTVSIVIPVFNQLALTRQCLACIQAHTPQSFEVIVVDNGSTDGTAAFLETQQVKVLHNDQNQGFAVACNQGAEAATGEWIVFLNNDTEPLEGWLEPLIETALSDPSVGIVGSKLLYPDGTLQHAGMLFGANRLPFHRGRGWPQARFDEAEDLQCVTGACLMIEKSLFQEVGGFDPSYRNGFEDVELCLQVGQRGRRVVYQPRSVLIHYESKTQGRKAHMLSNQRLFLSRWAGKVEPDDRAYLASLGFWGRLKHAAWAWQQETGLGRTWLKERLGLPKAPTP